MTTKTQTENSGVTNEILALASLGLGEGGTENEEVTRMQMSSVLNRLDSGGFGNTITEVINNTVSPYYAVGKDLYNNALSEKLEEGSPNDLRMKKLIQQASGLVGGTIERVPDVMYYFRPKEEKNMKPEDFDFKMVSKVGSMDLSDKDKYNTYGNQKSVGTRGDALRAARKEGQPFAYYNGVKYSTEIK